jgi:hypothetical protein
VWLATSLGGCSGSSEFDDADGLTAAQTPSFVDPVHPAAETKSPLFRAAPGDVLAISIEARFASLFARVTEHADTDATGQARVFERGILSYVDANGATVRRAIEVRLRGQTSLSECSFPKMKIRFTEDVRGTVFDGLAAGPDHASTLKIGTHCRTEATPSELGRVVGDRGPVREAFAYAALAVLGVPTHKVRLAAVTYVDTTNVPRRELHSAFLLEDDDTLVERYGAAQLFEDDDEVEVRVDRIGSGHLARHMLGEDLVGNWDWFIDRGVMGFSLHNVQLARRTSDRGVLDIVVAHDLDLSSVVTARFDAASVDRLFVPGYHEADGAALRQAVRNVQATRVRDASFTDSGLEGVAAGFRRRRDALAGLVERWPFDAESRALARAHVDAFYRALEPALLARPASAREIRPDGCGGAVAAGTPVTILETRSGPRGPSHRVRFMYIGCHEQDYWVSGSDLRGRLP